MQVETTVSKHNEDVLIENYEWFRNNLDVDTVFTLLTRGSPKEPLSKFFDVEKYETYAAHMEKEYKNGSLSGYDSFPFADFINAKRIVRHRLIAKIVKTNEYQIPCYAGNLGGAMFANGDVYPCELLIDRKLGTCASGLRLQEDLARRRGREGAQVIRESKCFCTYECFLTITSSSTPTMMPSVSEGMVEPEAPQAWRKLSGKQPAPPTTDLRQQTSPNPA